MLLKWLRKIANGTAARFNRLKRTCIDFFKNSWNKIRRIIHTLLLGFLRGSYKIYTIIYTEITTPIKILSLILIVVGNLILFKFAEGFKVWGAVISVGIFLLLCFLLFAIHLIINHIMRPSGSKSVFSTSDFFSPNKAKKFFEIKPPSCNSDFSFDIASESDMEVIATLNKKAFHRTIWDTKEDEKLERNRTHLSKNNLCFLLIKSRGKAVGFTHIIPINKSTWDKYKAGKISDIGFSDHYIVPSKKQAIDDNPHGLLLFTVAITEVINKFKNDPTKAYRKNIGDLLTQAIVFHINEFCKSLFLNYRIVPIIFQAMSSDVIDVFKDMKTNGVEFSKDGAMIICFEINNSNFTPLTQ